MWKHLVETGFLGTDRKQIQKDQLPDTLLNSLTKVNEDNNENFFLNALSLAHYYNESGEVAHKYEGEVVEDFLEEHKTEISLQMELTYRRINKLESSTVKTKLIHLWLDRIIEKEQVIGYPLFKEAVDFGERKGADIKDKITKVLSKNTLRAFIQFNKINKNWAITPISKEGWYTGKMAERKRFLEKVLANDPGLALTLLEETWPQETLSTKVSLLNCIYENPSEELLPFLEHLYEGEYCFEESEKEKQREGRAILSKILLPFPSSKLCQETIQQLVPCFTKRALISKLKWKLNFPKEQSEGFWSEKSMLQKYGLDANGFSSYVHSIKEEDWMAYFIQYVPFRAFADALNTKEEHIINCLFDSKELQRKTRFGDTVESAFISELTHKARFQKTSTSKKLVNAFIEKRNRNIYDLRDILFTLDRDEVEELIVQNNIFRTTIDIIGYDHHSIPDLHFSYEMSKKFLLKIHSKYYEWQRRTGADVLGLVLSKEVLDDLEVLNKKVENEKPMFQTDQDSYQESLQVWKNHVYIPIKEAIEIRTLLEEEKELVAE
ncbi:DUF5691 domain-containing protein [Flammeovirga aprica]|uniref:Uncharacterized protein n=1 Tax=Flammeovirga aprica JL-4 TaxID=694437 RepID=A0A7X9RXF8_9BACT|nr:DUF5691 domain-containing protein [Flammeovirga aprica]NME70477.1 hypothetical protein [Flammeovirga aprica JL-4]